MLQLLCAMNVVQERNRELQEEVKFLESQRLQQWEGKHSSMLPSKHSNTPPGSAPSQLQPMPARSSREHVATSKDGAGVWGREELAGAKAASTAGPAVGMGSMGQAEVQHPGQLCQDGMDASDSEFLDDGYGNYAHSVPSSQPAACHLRLAIRSMDFKLTESRLHVTLHTGKEMREGNQIPFYHGMQANGS